MMQHCSQCGLPFVDDADVVAVVRSRFKAIPSRVVFAIKEPTELYELQHYACAHGDLLPDDDLELLD